MCEREAIGASSMLRLIRNSVTLARSCRPYRKFHVLRKQSSFFFPACFLQAWTHDMSSWHELV